MRHYAIIGFVITLGVAYTVILNLNHAPAPVVVGSNLAIQSLDEPFRKLQLSVVNMTKKIADDNIANTRIMKQVLSRQDQLVKDVLTLKRQLNAEQISKNESTSSKSTSQIRDGVEIALTEQKSIEMSKPDFIPESDLGLQIDKSINLGNVDANLSSLASEQALLIVSEISNVSLEELICGEKVCRATINHQPGDADVVSRLFGKPPFDNENFTIEDNTGRVRVYFTQPGVTIDELRNDSLLN